ncbi:MAG: Hpt domain-containing protein [Bdellovibrionales bacterium]|nr:Hpt domain-containing protein [Bdellovibrionales bacterium]
MVDESVTHEFLLESEELLDSFESDLVTLEQDPSRADLVVQMFRALHTIKGNAGTFGFAKLEALCHSGESLLDALRNGQVRLDAEMASALLASIDTARRMLSSIAETGDEGEPAPAELLASLASFH